MRPRGLLTIAGCCLVGVFFLTSPFLGWQGAGQSFFANASLRVGLVALAVALAWPQLIPIWRRFPPWFWAAAIMLTLLLLVVQPRFLLVAMALLLALVLIQGGSRWISSRLFRDR